MNPLFSALESGYSPEDVIKYLSKAIPKMSEPIRKASRAGYTVQQILGFLSKTFDAEDRRGMSETERHAANNRADAERTKFGLKMVAGAIASPIAAAAARSALSRALPNGLKNLSAGMNPIASPANPPASAANINQVPSNPSVPGNSSTLQPGMTQQQGQPQNVSQQPPINQNVASVTQPQQVAQPEGIINPKEYLEKLGIKDKVDDLLKNGNTPEQVAAVLGMKSGAGKLKAEIDPELVKNIDEYSKVKEKKSPEIDKSKEKVEEKQPKYSLNEKYLSKLFSSKEKQTVGTLGDFLEGSELRKKFKDVLNIPIIKAPKENDIYDGAFGTDDKGNPIIVMSPLSEENFFDTLIEEATHALQFIKGRHTGESTLENYDIHPQEISSKKHVDFLKNKYNEEKKQLDQEKIKKRLEQRIKKSNIVASHEGIGEVKEIRNGQAIIDVDGKLHKVKEHELESEPEEVIESKFDFDPSKIPEELRSAPLNEVYTPGDRRHVTVKFNAGLKPVRYLYYRKDGQPIPDQFISKIKEGVQLPITSGLNFWGAWDASKSDSRGAANYQELVSNSQEEGEEDDPSKEYWLIKEEEIYSHPYNEKAGKEELRRREKEFNEANKKRKKKRT